MTLETTIALASLVVNLLAPLLIWWGGSKFFQGSLKQWKETVDGWREDVDKKLDNITTLSTQVAQHEKDIDRLFHRRAGR